MKQLGLAVHNFHDTRNGLPPGIVDDGLGTTFVWLFPYSEQQALYDLAAQRLARKPPGAPGWDAVQLDKHWWNGDTEVDGGLTKAGATWKKSFSSVSFMRCPSRRGSGPLMTGDDTYGGWDGIKPGPQGDYAVVMSSWPSMASSFFWWWNLYDSVRDGNIQVGGNRGPFRQAVIEGDWWDYKWTPRDTMAWLADGTSNQLLMGEKHIPRKILGQCLFSGQTGAYANSTGGDCSYIAASASGSGASHGRYVVAGDNGASPPQPNARPISYGDDYLGNNSFDLGFGSAHPGVCHFLLGDGSIRGVSVTTAGSILGALGTVNDGVSVSLP